MNRRFWKKVQFPFWCVGMYPLMFVCWMFSDYSKGWPFHKLWRLAVKHYWAGV